MIKKNKGITDRYGLQLAGVCPCIVCSRKKSDKAYSCEIYTEQCGIPSSVWKGKQQCGYFEPKHPE